MNRQQRRAAAKSGKSPTGSAVDMALQSGIASHQAGRLKEAERFYREVLARQPHHPDALHLLGVAHLQSGQAEPGVQLIRQAIAQNGRNPEYFSNLGAALHRLQRLEEASEAYRGAIALNPDYATAFNNLGNVLQALNRPDEALASYDQAIRAQPLYAEAHDNRGKVLQRFGRAEEALASFDQTLAINPRNPQALCRRAVILSDLKRYNEALSNTETAKVIAPHYAEAFNVSGGILHKLGRHAEALADFDRTLALDPEHLQANLNRAALLQDLRRFDEAAASLQQALRIRPGCPEAHWNAAIQHLLLGDYTTGWKLHEWRWQCGALRLQQRTFNAPLWLGEESLAGKTILLHSDLGLGDAIHFARYVPLVAAKGARVILHVDGPLKDLFAALPDVTQCLAKHEPLPAFDMHCPLASLPLAFGTKLTTIPAAPYLIPIRDLAPWHSKLGAARKPRIGLVWSGNPHHANDHNRSLHFGELAPLLAMPATFVSLQKDLRPQDAEALKARGDILDFGPELQDFADTASLLSCLDLVISVDTSVAHLAGALGRPVWILLPYAPDWRWLLDRKDSPWYPSARLFRQDETRQWPLVLDQVRTALAQLIG